MAVSESGQYHAVLHGILDHFEYDLNSAYSVVQALDFLHLGSVAIIICDRELPDGTWKDLFKESALQSRHSYLIVTSNLAHDTDLWGEVLNMGGGEVLAMPFEPAEVIGSVKTGGHHWKRTVQPTLPSCDS
jgi:DNA-binding response OmpR family regulator